MPLNILHVDTEKTWRGGERQAYFLIKYLSQNEFKSYIAAPSSAPFFKRVSELSCTPIHFTMGGEWDLRAAFRLSRIIRQYKIDIVHAHTSHALGIASMAKLFCPVKLVASRRVDYPLSKNIFSKLKYRSADRIIAISNAVRNILIDNGIAKTRIDVVNSGVELRRNMALEVSLLWQELGIPPENRIIGIVGALTSQKDHDTFIKAAQQVKKHMSDISFLIIGEGERKKEISSLVEQYDLAQQVVMTGFRDDAMDLIELFDIYVVSSCYEGMGTSTLDAMYREKPVVATKVGGIPEIVDDGVTGYLVPAGDSSAMAEKIVYLLNNKKEAINMGKAGKERARLFSAEKTAQGTAEVYKKLL